MRVALVLAALHAAVPSAAAREAAAGSTAPPAIAACAGIADPRDRLDCYDRASGRGAPADAPSPQNASPGAPLPAGPDERARLAREERRALGTSLGERWELEPSTRQGRFVLRPYKPMYILPLRWSNDPNQQPSSPGEGNSVAVPQDLNSLEAAFQISLKSKVWETIGGSNVDLWLAYTQKSHWQVYNGGLSRPFRETNYEPEAFALWGFDQPLAFGWRARFVGLGLNHQSNGRSEPLSRSWNRVIAQAGFENGPWTVLLRPWWRVKESAGDDDNPDIEDYVGRGEAVVVRRIGAHEVSLQWRGLMGGRGSLQLDWAYPLASYLKGHLQLFSGYGESLIDYNHRQTTIGIGVSLVEWQ